MGLLTTTIGAYPKPDYVNLPDWFDDLDTSEPTEGWAEAMEAMGKDAESIIEKGVLDKLINNRKIIYITSAIILLLSIIIILL